MANRREFWIRHVRAWRGSGMTVRAYCQRHRLARGSLGSWAWKLDHEKDRGGKLVEVGRRRVLPSAGPAAVAERPVEILVSGRYVLRTWPGTPEKHLEMVVGVLERRP